MCRKISDIDNLLNYINESDYKMYVVCGYDNTGKGFILDQIHEDGWKIFYPDYKLICENAPTNSRWSYFMYFLNVLNSFDIDLKDYKGKMIFDRSSICGAVYNKDWRIAEEYSRKISNLPIVHILVTCDRSTFDKLCDVRGNEVHPSYKDYLEHTSLYKEFLEVYDIPYIEFVNEYDEYLGEELSNSCGGCTHYKGGKCLNEESGKMFVHKDDPRCSHSRDLDIQDRQQRGEIDEQLF